MIAGDVLTVGTGAGAILDKHAGTGKTVNVSGLALGGADAGNYTLASVIASTSADITPATISSITGITAQGRVYDGTTAAMLNTGGASFNGMIAGDVLDVGASAGSFLDKHVGSGKTVDISSLALGGADAANYMLASDFASTAADITPATISSISDIVAQNRVYDGTTAATLNTGVATFNGMVAGDALSIGAGGGEFFDKNAGTGKTVSITGLALSGTDASNYVLASAASSATADITPATIDSIAGITAQSRVYDGTTAATLNTSGATFNGVIGADVLTVGASGGAFSDKHAGTGKTVNITGLALAGGDAANYVLAGATSSATADITPATISSITGISAVNRIYDGTTAATLINIYIPINSATASDRGISAVNKLEFDSARSGAARTASSRSISVCGRTSWRSWQRRRRPACRPMRIWYR